MSKTPRQPHRKTRPTLTDRVTSGDTFDPKFVEITPIKTANIGGSLVKTRYGLVRRNTLRNVLPDGSQVSYTVKDVPVSFEARRTPPDRYRSLSYDKESIVKKKDEGLVKEPPTETFESRINAVLAEEGVATESRPQLVAEFRRMVARAKGVRPSWLGRKERGGELAALTAPLFLKRVYADEIAPDGTVQKELIRTLDPPLMDAIETYISSRTRRGRDLGDASGLVFVTSRPPTNAIHGTRPNPSAKTFA
jgi:hypothetical protein